MLIIQCINIVCRLIQLVESVGMTSSEISGRDTPSSCESVSCDCHVMCLIIAIVI